MSAILQRWAARLRLGQLSQARRAELESEGRILYLAEGIWEWAIFRHFKSWAHDARWARCGFIGFFALSERRMVVIVRARYAKMEINVAYDEARFQKMTFAATPKYLSLAFDASVQNAQMSGQVELRLHLPDVATAAKILEQAGARIESNGR
jgi:hypothetical protein